jgi:tetratricopeptide (TPR) repeat protein
VNQQSEHLSNAQIEQYGKRASGAEPETEAWVEQHLDDCPSCRSRVLDFQRTRFALLLNQKVNTVPSSNCPSEDDLRNLAAGLCAEPIANKLKAHAATCHRCGPLLQEYIEDFSDESSPEEQAFLDQLRTSSPEFRQQKAREMLQREMLKKNPVTPEPAPATDWRSFFSWKWIMIPAAAVIALAAITFPVYLAWRDTPEKTEALLAHAQEEHRTIEMRWPKAKRSPYSVSLGESDQRPSYPLLKAEKALTGRSGSSEPAWSRAEAEKEIALGHPANAIAILASSSSTSADLDRAMAYFVQGEQTHDSRPYYDSRDALDRVLQRDPNNTAAMFNRAIIYERLQLYPEAAEEWNLFLKIEKDPAWLREARERLQKVEEMLRSQGK